MSLKLLVKDIFACLGALSLMTMSQARCAESTVAEQSAKELNSVGIEKMKSRSFAEAELLFLKALDSCTNDSECALSVMEDLALCYELEHKQGQYEEMQQRAAKLEKRLHGLPNVPLLEDSNSFVDNETLKRMELQWMQELSEAESSGSKERVDMASERLFEIFVKEQNEIAVQMYFERLEGSLKSKRKFSELARLNKKYIVFLHSIHEDRKAAAILEKSKALSNSLITNRSPSTNRMVLPKAAPISQIHVRAKKIEQSKPGVEDVVKVIHVLTDIDHETIAKPRFATRDVFDHYETEIVGWQYDAYGQRTPITRQRAVYRTEEYEVWKVSDLDISRTLRELAEVHSIRTRLDSMVSNCLAGGAIIELSSGWLLMTEREPPKLWYAGDNVRIIEHPNLMLPYVVVVRRDNQETLTAEALTAR